MAQYNSVFRMSVNYSMLMRDCDSCRSAPGSVYCHADSAVLCAACDADVHSANLFSHRHHRVPVLGIAGDTDQRIEEDDEGGGYQGNYAALFGEVVDEYLDLGEFNNSCDDEKPAVKREVSAEGVVPVQSAALSHGVSLSSMEANSVVPDATTAKGLPCPHARPSKGTIELFSGPPIQVPAQFSPMDREARVLRYREKKKSRKFEKTIRYASRKAYAEARPRIKGRFAKRSEVELEVGGDSGNMTSLIVPAATLGAFGYGYMWWKGISFSDLMYVTKRSMGNAVSNMTNHLEKVSAAVAAAKSHLTQRIENLDGKLDEQKAISREIKHEVTDVRGKVSNIGFELSSLQQLVSGLDGKINAIEYKQKFTCDGVMYLCQFVHERGGAPDFMKDVPKLTGKPRYAGSTDTMLKGIALAIESGNFDKPTKHVISDGLEA